MKRIIIISLMCCGSVFAQQEQKAEIKLNEADLKEFNFELTTPMFVKQFDANKDGTLDDAEKASAIAKLKQRKEHMKKMQQSKAVELLAKYDADKDGKLSKDEIVASFEGEMAERRAHMQAMMRKYKERTSKAPKDIKPPKVAPKADK